MKLFYGSFGIGHLLSEYIQPIKADSRLEAQKMMLKKHGRNFCGIYTEKEFSIDNYKFLEILE